MRIEPRLHDIDYTNGRKKHFKPSTIPFVRRDGVPARSSCTREMESLQKVTQEQLEEFFLYRREAYESRLRLEAMRMKIRQLLANGADVEIGIHEAEILERRYKSGAVVRQLIIR